MTPPRRCIRVVLGLALAGNSGCALMGAVADGLVDEGPPGTAPSRPDPVSAVAGAGDGAFTGGEHRTSTRATRSGYIATPALTWGALQLQRPHALSGSLFSSRGLARGECSRASRQPFEANGMGGDGISIISIASDAARHGPVVFTGTGIPVELSLSLDRDVMSERVMRTGAFLVQRGPVCAESLFFMASWTWVSADQTAVTTSW